MTFRDEIAGDLSGVFLNADEFAEEHTIEGRRILCVIDESIGKEKSDGAEFDLSQSDLSLIARTDSLPPRKASGALLNVDGREMVIDTWKDDCGMTTIGLSVPETA